MLGHRVRRAGKRGDWAARPVPPPSRRQTIQALRRLAVRAAAHGAAASQQAFAKL